MTPKAIIQNHLIRQVYLSNAEIAEIFSPRFDYEEACMSAEGREFHVDLDEAIGNYFWWEAISIEVLLKPDVKAADLNNESDPVFLTARQAWFDCAQTNNINPNPIEVLEVWLVSDWLYNKLDCQDESVVIWKGLPLWGRTSTGLPVDREDVIEAIARL
ncbi:hypothetical protein [Chamaesiphon sp.]|uniref:hypothetical protein n=1 Tax=Chamaesiphon sp. TaxID=2814140 RepID=UPI0035938328